MLKTILLVISVLALARAQVPSLGFCPEYVPMTDFDMSKFLGVWYEAEKSLQLPEFGSRCAMASYTKGPDNKYRVSNVIGRILGFQRVIEGEIILPSSKADEGKINLRYTTTLSNLPSLYHMLHTDYKSYAVMWNCNSLGPVHTENLWIMTRERQPSSETMQKAYGILDKYKISKSYLSKSDQTDCRYTGFEDLQTDHSVDANKPELPVGEEPDRFRSAIIPESAANDNNKALVKSEIIENESLKKQSINKEEGDKLPLPSSVAEVILKTVDQKEKNCEIKKEQDHQKPAVSLLKIEPAVAKPIKELVDVPTETHEE